MEATIFEQLMEQAMVKRPGGTAKAVPQTRGRGQGATKIMASKPLAQWLAAPLFQKLGSTSIKILRTLHSP
jgi:hypothetical protein